MTRPASRGLVRQIGTVPAIGQGPFRRFKMFGERTLSKVAMKGRLREGLTEKAGVADA
jgi:hypothetical protein